jgi:hypothetical protein
MMSESVSLMLLSSSVADVIHTWKVKEGEGNLIDGCISGDFPCTKPNSSL